MPQFSFNSLQTLQCRGDLCLGIPLPNFIHRLNLPFPMFTDQILS
jgi:hypothetical protein